MGTQQERNKEIVTQAFEAIEKGRYDSLRQFIKAHYVRHCQATPDADIDSLDDFIALLELWDHSFSDIENRADLLIAEGRYVAFVGCFSGTQTGPMGPFPATGKRMESEFAGYHRLEEGKIAETWDYLFALEQLGHFPPPEPDD